MRIAEAASVSGAALKEWSGAGIVIIGGLYAFLTFLGFGFEFPWAARAEIITIQQQLSIQQGQLAQTIKQQQVEDCTLYRILRDGYRKDQSEAEADLSKNPNSEIARRSKQQAADNISQMDFKINSPPCV